MEQVVFVTGCSRSGTTALVNLLNSHENVALGMERYKYLYPTSSPGDLLGLFHPDRFLDFRTGDTNVRPNGNNRWWQFYEDVRCKLESGCAKIVGDKPIARVSITAKLWEAYPSAKWVFIFRDLRYVAASFEARANDPHDAWPLRHGYRSALKQWSEAFEAAEFLEKHSRPIQLYRISYDSFFAQDLSQFESLRKFLQLPRSERQEEYYHRTTEEWQQRARRPPRLFPAALSWLDQQAPWGVEARFRDLAMSDRNHFRTATESR